MEPKSENSGRMALIRETLALLRETRMKIGKENPALLALLERSLKPAEEEPLSRKNRRTVMKYLAAKKRKPEDKVH